MELEYWKISPENIERSVQDWEAQWNRCIRERKIAIGWDEVGDLEGLSLYQVKARLLENFPEYNSANYRSRLTLDAYQLLDFRDIQVGAIVVANRGQSVIAGVGKVDGDYYFDKDAEYFKHTLPVKWLDTTRRVIRKQQSWLQTVFPLESQEVVALGISGIMQRDRTVQNYEDDLRRGARFSERMARSRMFQQAFRNVLLENYQGKCAVCDVDDEAFLRGCHIVPVGEDESICTDVENGICLCVLHDVAFEKGIFSINDDYTIQVSESFSTSSGALQSAIINLQGNRISLPIRSYPNRTYLKRHREKHGF